MTSYNIVLQRDLEGVQILVSLGSGQKYEGSTFFRRGPNSLLH